MSTLNIVRNTRHRMPNREITTHSNTSIKGPSNQWADTNITIMRQSKLTTEKHIKTQTTTNAEQLDKNLHEQQTNQQNTKNKQNQREEENQRKEQDSSIGDQRNRDRWGDDLIPKASGHLRFLLQNIGGIDLTPSGSIKLAALREFINQASVDVVAITECNAAWDNVATTLHPTEQTRYWWECSQWSVGHNRQENYQENYQPGGTGIIILNELAHRAQRPGDDKIGLGRWCWARLRGKDNQYLRIISAYRPVKSNGPLPTYQQQVRYWTK